MSRENRGDALGGGSDCITVARLPEDIRQRLAVSGKEVLLSRQTLEKQKKHPEITQEHYERFLQRLLDEGERIYDRERHVVVIQSASPPYVAVLKATRAGDEVYLQSLRRSDEKNIAALRARKGVGGG